ncbi:MAG TPA: ABC transporter permease [Anaerolineales bacterium]|nr:ABC transporter permease [Anaerolineales bacterium]
MEISPEIQSTLRDQIYIWRIRLELWWRNFRNFLQELGMHPLAMIGGVVLVLYLVFAVFADQITVHNPIQGNLRLRHIAPVWQAGDWTYPLGTDSQGRDLLTRIIYGARVSLSIGFLSVGISLVVGILLGTLAGYFGGRFDSLVSRLADLLLAFPFLIFAIGVMAFLGPGFTNLILALTFKGWVEFFRLVRGEMLAEKTKEYVEAARVTGQGHLAIIMKEILPNIIQSVFVLGTLRMGYMIITEASLSFLGLGLPPNIPAWGSMVATGRDSMLVAWWVSTFPGLAILFLVMAINVFGEGLRDILDPRLKLEG